MAFYPGCQTELTRGFEPTVPLLMLLAELDDWTVPAPTDEQLLDVLHKIIGRLYLT